jgi:hypothetical protein
MVATDARESPEKPFTDFIEQCAQLQTEIVELKRTSRELQLLKLLRGEATAPTPPASTHFWSVSQYARPNGWNVGRGRDICSEHVTGLWDCTYLFFNIHGEHGGTCVLHTILRQITNHHTEAEFRDPDLEWVRSKDPAVYPDAAPVLPWNTEGADLGLVQRVLNNDKYC